MSGHKLHVSSKITDPAGILHVGDLEYMCKTKSAVALPGGAGWSGRWMRWAGPVLPGRVFLCASPQAGGAGCELTHAGSAVGPGSAPSRWSCRSVAGETAHCRVCSGKGKACCRSGAVSLQVTGSAWRRAPMGCGAFISFISSGFSVALVPQRWQSACNSWSHGTAQGPRCLAACTAHTFVAQAAHCRGSS